MRAIQAIFRVGKYSEWGRPVIDGLANLVDEFMQQIAAALRIARPAERYRVLDHAISVLHRRIGGIA